MIKICQNQGVLSPPPPKKKPSSALFLTARPNLLKTFRILSLLVVELNFIKIENEFLKNVFQLRLSLDTVP